ncbi:unnamed protein product [Angiostrongylus costaricensis]|uniref:Lipase_3 domain-containing protein n=1 Tax=Angiostrongylus costaricensis TaxID=334426 RepID=A0A158PH01_ANGCS|nr:unnamed protein product [Angiostrongylus costaricensis]
MSSGGETTGERPENLGLRNASLEPGLKNTRTTRHGDGFLLCTYNAKALSTVSDLYTLSVAADRIKFHVIALQETKIRKTGIRQLNNGTLVIGGEKVPSRNGGGVGFAVYPSIVHLVDSYVILSPCIAVHRLQVSHHKKITIINCYSPTDAADEVKIVHVNQQYELVLPSVPEIPISPQDKEGRGRPNELDHGELKALFFGHSLGGAKAEMSALSMLFKRLISQNKVRLLTFGSTRVGDMSFVQLIETLVPYRFRIVHGRDMVPHYPRKFDGEWTPPHHHRYEVWYPNGMRRGAKYVVCLGAEDPQCSCRLSPWEIRASDNDIYFGRTLSKPPPLRAISSQYKEQKKKM